MTSPPPKHSLSSPTAGNPHQPVLPTPSSSTSVSLRQLNYRSNQLKKELELQLSEKQRLMQESSSGIGKNVLARQITQLQERIKEIDSVTQHMDLQSTNSIERLRSLERDLTSYRSHPLSPGISSIRNKEKLLNQRSTSSSSAGNGLSPLPSPSASTLIPSAHGHDSTSLLPLPPPPTGSTPTKRRSKIPTTDRRNTDIEFATEIGQGLLLEVRKMQALLQEKEEKLRALENQKADLERTAEAMAKQMRQREENEEKLKEETWNLELAKQELVISVTDLQSNLNKATSEQNKLSKQTTDLRSEIEHLRDREEKLASIIEHMKQRHEQDITNIRRQAAGFQREKQEQSKRLEALKSELAILKAQSRIGKPVEESTSRVVLGEQSTPSQTTGAVSSDHTPTSSPPTSPKISPSRSQAMEFETLKTSLAHAHRMVSNLRSNLHKEKTEKFEFKKLLAESQETIEQLRSDPRLWAEKSAEESPGRRSRKASSSSSSKRRAKKNSTTRPKFSKKWSENDSVYSYSSMSESGEEESEAEKMKFTVLSSELSKMKPVMVDAQVNTEPYDTILRLAGTSNVASKQQVFGQTKLQPLEATAVAVEAVKTTRELQTKELALSVQEELVPKSNELQAQTEPQIEQTKLEIKQRDVVVPTLAKPDLQMQTHATQSVTIPEPNTVEIGTQTNTMAAVESYIQTDDALLLATEIRTAEVSIQTEPTVAEEILTQTETPISCEIHTQTEAPVFSSKTFTQTKAPSASFELCVQTETATFSEAYVQTVETATILLETCVQTDDVVPFEASVQTESSSSADTCTQTHARVLSHIALESVFYKPATVTLTSCTQTPVDVHPEDPALAASLLAASTAAAVAAARLASVTAAVNQETQYDLAPATLVDQETQYNSAPGVDQETQHDPVLIDQETQYETSGADCGVQSDTVTVHDVSIQMDAIQLADAFTQYDVVVTTTDAMVQSDAVETIDTLVQSEWVDTKDAFVQSELAETKDMLVVQAEPPHMSSSVDVLVQSESVQQMDAAIQCELITQVPVQEQRTDMANLASQCAILAEKVGTGVQPDVVATGDSVARSVSVETSDQVEITNRVDSASLAEKKDTLAHSDVVEMRDSITQTASFQDKDVPHQLSVADIADSASIEKKDLMVQSNAVRMKDSISQAVFVDTFNAPLQAEPVETFVLRDSIVYVERKDAHTQYDVDFSNSTVLVEELLPPVASEDYATSVFVSKSGNPMATSVDGRKQQALEKTTPLPKNEVADITLKEDTYLLQNKAPTKVYTQAETDALVAAAVASALESATANEECTTDPDLHEPKRHTCDMSANNNMVSSVATTPYTGSLYMIDDYDASHYTEEDFGDVMVHLPTDQDIITYSPYRKERERYIEVPRTLELSIGPSIVHEFKPTEDELSPVTVVGHEEHKEPVIIEVPARPTRKPPTDLLTKAKTSSPLIDAYVKMEKAASLGGSSLSSANEDIEPAQYQGDSTVVSLITQTMIGDWMWKYTKNAVGYENRHQRFFWIHPYTRTLYWSTQAPGGEGGGTKAKSVFIESVTSVPDHSATHYGLPNVSLLIQTSQRQLKITAPTLEKHDAWLESLSYLVTHNEDTNATSGITLLNDTTTKKPDPLISKSRSLSSMTSGSLLKGPHFRRTNDIVHHSSISTSMTEDDDHEPLEDVRMCCNGKHHVSRLERDPTHKHHHRKRKSRATIATVA